MDKLLYFIKKYKIACIVIIIVILAFINFNKKEYKFTECYTCGNEGNCYKVTYHAIKDKSENASYYFDKKECEDQVTNMMTWGGWVKE